jgi:peptide chain release factor 3
VFKVQANMDPNHRDRIAFARVCSGEFERGMGVINTRTGRDVGTKYATTAFGADRETVERAYPGDIIGLINAGGLQIGDTLYGGDRVEFPGVPRFAPEVFAYARPLDTSRAKQFRRGLAQLDEEGVVQVFRDDDGSTEPVLAAVGALQFDVFAHRLASEFNAPIEIRSAPYQAIRLTDAASARRLRTMGGIRIMRRGDDALVALFESRYRLERLESTEPELTLDAILADTDPTPAPPAERS